LAYERRIRGKKFINNESRMSESQRPPVFLTCILDVVYSDGIWCTFGLVGMESVFCRWRTFVCHCIILG